MLVLENVEAMRLRVFLNVAAPEPRGDAPYFIQCAVKVGLPVQRARKQRRP